MKKFKYIASIFAALGMLSVSCENERDTNLPDAAVYIVNDGLQVSETFYAVDESAKTPVRIFRSGYFDQTVTASVRLSEKALADYNRANGTDYKLLPEDNYEVDANSVALTSDNRTGNLYVTFTDPAALFALKESEGLDNYVIPLELVSDGNVNSEHNSILILPDVLEQVLLSFDQADTQFFVDGGVSPDDQKLTVSVARPLKEDVVVRLDMSQDAIDWYNTTHHASFRLPPSGFASIAESSLVLKSGQTSVSTTLSIDPSRWDGAPCAVPVRLVVDGLAVNPDKECLLLHYAPASDDFNMYEPLDRYNWTIDGLYYHGTVGGSGKQIPTLWRIIDGLTVNSFWDAPYSSSAVGNPNNGKMPIDFTIDFGAVKTICGIGIRNRDGSYCDRLKAGYFEISKDGANWVRVAEFGFVKGQVDANRDYKYWFEPAEARYMRMTITESNAINGEYHQASLAEAYAYAPADKPYKALSRLSQTGWSADANSYQNNDTCGKLIDGNEGGSHWEAGYNSGSKTPNNLKVPFVIQVDMSSAQSIDGVEMWRRNTIGKNESIFGLKSGSIWVSETADDSDWKTSTAWQTSGKWTKAGEFDFEVNASMLVGPFYYMLPQTTKARYIRIYITDSNDKNATRDTAAIGEIFAVRK